MRIAPDGSSATRVLHRIRAHIRQFANRSASETAGTAARRPCNAPADLWSIGSCRGSGLGWAHTRRVKLAESQAVVILDRLLHDAEALTINGPCWRLRGRRRDLLTPKPRVIGIRPKPPRDRPEGLAGDREIAGLHPWKPRGREAGPAADLPW